MWNPIYRVTMGCRRILVLHYVISSLYTNRALCAKLNSCIEWLWRGKVRWCGNALMGAVLVLSSAGAMLA